MQGLRPVSGLSPGTSWGPVCRPPAPGPTHSPAGEGGVKPSAWSAGSREGSSGPPVNVAETEARGAPRGRAGHSGTSGDACHTDSRSPGKTTRGWAPRQGRDAAAGGERPGKAGTSVSLLHRQENEGLDGPGGREEDPQTPAALSLSRPPPQLPRLPCWRSALRAHCWAAARCPLH